MSSRSSESRNKYDSPKGSAGQPSGAKYQGVWTGSHSTAHFGDHIGVQNINSSHRQDEEQRKCTNREKVIQQLLDDVCGRLPPVPRPRSQIKTRRWVLKDQHFKRWLEYDKDIILWVAGSPGCGKTVLLRSLVETELCKLGCDKNATILYFFFGSTSEDTRKQSIAMRALLHQKLLQNRPLADLVDSVANLEDSRTLWHAFTKVMGSAMAGNSICIIDGLDECDNIREFFDGLSDFLRGREPEIVHGYCKFLLASRPHDSIGFALERACHSTLMLRIDCNEEKIREEVERVILSDIKDLQLRTKAEERLRKLVLGAKPLRYLWWRTVLQHLEMSTDRNSFHVLDEVVKSIPTELNKMYHQLIKSIPSHEVASVRRLLGAVLASRGPLSVEALAELHALHPETRRFEDLEIPHDFAQKLPIICRFFVVAESGTVSFFHDTAREFLLSERAAEEANTGLLFSMESAHQGMLDASIEYLLLQDISNLRYIDWPFPIKIRFHTPGYPTETTFKPCGGNALSLQFIALKDFTYNLRLCRQSVLASSARIKRVLDLCKSPISKHIFTRTSWHHHDSHMSLISYESLLPRMYALDLHGLVSDETYAHEINTRDSRGFTALHIAAWAGDHAEVRKLLSYGADPEVEAVSGLTPIELCFWAPGDFRIPHVSVANLGQRRDVANALAMEALRTKGSRSNRPIGSVFYWALVHKFEASYYDSLADCGLIKEWTIRLEWMRRAEDAQHSVPRPLSPGSALLASPPYLQAAPEDRLAFMDKHYDRGLEEPAPPIATAIHALRKKVEDVASKPKSTSLGFSAILSFLLCGDGAPTVLWMVVLWEVARFSLEDIAMLEANCNDMDKLREITQIAVKEVVKAMQLIVVDRDLILSSTDLETDTQYGNISSLTLVHNNTVKGLEELIKVKKAFKKQLREYYPDSGYQCGTRCFGGEVCDIRYFEQISYFL